MGTFQRTETVDARQFTGGIENGTNLALWVNSNGQMTETRAEWRESVTIAGRSISDRVRIMTPRGFQHTAFVGDWIVQKQVGSFIVLRPEELILKGYVQV